MYRDQIMARSPAIAILLQPSARRRSRSASMKHFGEVLLRAEPQAGQTVSGSDSEAKPIHSGGAEVNQKLS